MRKGLLIGLTAVFCMLFYSSKVMAAPGGADLLSACRHALENGFSSIKGRMCLWYTLPCDCHAGEHPAPPRVCLPPEIPPETLARLVIRGLQEKPALLQEKAEYAAAMILVESYPCSDSSE